MPVTFGHGHIRALRGPGESVLQAQPTVDLPDDLRVVLDLVAFEFLLRLRVLPAGEFEGFRSDDLHEVVVLADGPRELHEVLSGRVLAFRVQPRGVLRLRVRHSQFRGLLVHQLHGLVLPACCPPQSIRGIIGARHQHRVEEQIDGVLVRLHETDLGPVDLHILELGGDFLLLVVELVDERQSREQLDRRSRSVPLLHILRHVQLPGVEVAHEPGRARRLRRLRPITEVAGTDVRRCRRLRRLGHRLRGRGGVDELGREHEQCGGKADDAQRQGAR